MSQNGTVSPAVRRDRFASGGQVRLDLSDGDWVLIRTELTYGQQRRLAHSGLTGIDRAAAEGEQLKVDLAAFDIERLVTWLLDWSFVDADGERVVVSREAIEALHPDTAQEIDAALDAYLEGQAAKKAPERPGAPRRAATSSSAKGSAGAGAS